MGKGGFGQRVALVSPGAPRPLPASSSSFLRPQAGAQCPPWPCPCASPSLRMANSVSTALPTPPLISLCFFLRTGVQGQALSCCHPVGSGGPEGHQLSIQPRGPRPRGSKHTHTKHKQNPSCPISQDGQIPTPCFIGSLRTHSPLPNLSRDVGSLGPGSPNSVPLPAPLLLSLSFSRCGPSPTLNSIQVCGPAPPSIPKSSFETLCPPALPGTSSPCPPTSLSYSLPQALGRQGEGRGGGRGQSRGPTGPRSLGEGEEMVQPEKGKGRGRQVGGGGKKVKGGRRAGSCWGPSPIAPPLGRPRPPSLPGPLGGASPGGSGAGAGVSRPVRLGNPGGWGGVRCRSLVLGSPPQLGQRQPQVHFPPSIPRPCRVPGKTGGPLHGPRSPSTARSFSGISRWRRHLLAARPEFASGSAAAGARRPSPGAAGDAVGKEKAERQKERKEGG